MFQNWPQNLYEKNAQSVLLQAMALHKKMKFSINPNKARLFEGSFLWVGVNLTGVKHYWINIKISLMLYGIKDNWRTCTAVEFLRSFFKVATEQMNLRITCLISNSFNFFQITWSIFTDINFIYITSTFFNF